MSSTPIRNKSGGDRFVPCLGREVAADEVVDCPDDLLDSLVCQPIWEAVQAPKKSAAAAK